MAPADHDHSHHDHSKTASSHGHGHHTPPPEGAETATDPVCGMKVAITPETRRKTCDGKTHYFCSEKCEKSFAEDPYFYTSGKALSQPKAAAPGTQYTCPMHPMIPSDEPSHELGDFTRRMWISVAAALPLMILTMGDMIGIPVRRCSARISSLGSSSRWRRPSSFGPPRPSSGGDGIRS